VTAHDADALRDAAARFAAIGMKRSAPQS